MPLEIVGRPMVLFPMGDFLYFCPGPMRFVNPACLYFLFAALIPVLVHLFDWQRYKKVYFSNVRLLQEIDARNRRQARLREYAVLASRVLTVACLVFAFARPYLPEDSGTMPVGGRTSVSLYLDNSFSMQAPAGRSVLLDKAKEQAERILQAFPPDARVQLLTNEFKGEDQAFSSPGEILDKLRQVDFCPATRSLSEVVARQQALFEQAGVPAVSRLFYYVSDCQETGFDWTGAPDSAARYVFVPVKGEEHANVSLDSLSLDMPVLQAGRETPLRVFLRNRSSKERLQLPLRLFVQGRQAGAWPVDLAPGQKKEVVLPLFLGTGGNLQGFVEIPDYPVRFDDRLYFSLRVAPKITVIHLFEENPSRAVSRVFAHDSAFDYRRVPLGSLDYGSLGTADLIVADALRQWPSALVSETGRFVRAGGSLFLIPCAPSADGAAFIPNERICRDLTGAALAPFVVEDRPVKRLDVEHPVFSLAFSSAGRNADLPFTRGHYPLPSSMDVPCRDLMGFSRETAVRDAGFLQVCQVDKGLLYLLASPLEGEYTDFQRHYTFVVALLDMALYHGGSGGLYHETGEKKLYFPSALFLGKPEGALCHLLSVDRPGFDLIPSLRRVGSETVLFLHDALLEAGNYVLSDGQSDGIPVSFNYDRAESGRECMDEAALRDRLRALRMRNGFVMNPDRIDLSKSVERMERGRELWKVFLIFALAFALFETVLLRVKKK